jgi:hypothetical protein
MSNEHTKVTDLSENQEKAIVDTKESVERLESVLLDLGQVRAFDFVSKLLTVSNLRTLENIKESKSYKGLTYRDADKKLLTVSSWDEFCQYKLQISRASVDNNLLNFSAFGEEFFEASQRIGLGTRELRKLRQLPDESQQLVINSEAVDLSDKESVKELIEDLNFKQVIEKSALENKLKDAEHTAQAARERSDNTQKEINQIKDVEAKRRFKQEPWQNQTLDNVAAMMHAKTAIEQGINQLGDVFDNLRNDDSLDDKAIDLIARSLLSEAQAAHALVNNFTNELFGVLGGKYRPDVSAEDTFLNLQTEDEPAEQSLAD